MPDITARFPDAEFYFFGSYIQEVSTISDVDLLIVSTSENFSLIDKNLHDLADLVPLHVLRLTHNEEGELDFIKKQGAKPVLQVLGINSPTRASCKM